MKSLVTTLLLFSSLTVFCHQDTPLVLKANGKIKGLPNKYSTARFNAENFTLSIRNNKIYIPNCIKKYLVKYENYQIRFSASWYHSSEFLPHYILMSIVTDTNPYGFQILFSLETLEILKISEPEMKLNRDGNDQYYSNEIEISEDCKNEIYISIVKF